MSKDWKKETSLSILLAVIHVKSIQVSYDLIAFERLNRCALEYREKYRDKKIGDVEGVSYARKLFREIGIDPTKRRPSSEALLNRALKAKELYSINTLVDVGNWCSLDFLLPICVHDADKIVGGVHVRIGLENESYIGHNNQEVHLKDRYVLADELGPFGSPITDSKRTAVDEHTRNAILAIFAPKSYSHELLHNQAQLFADRVSEICSGEIAHLGILS